MWCQCGTILYAIVMLIIMMKYGTLQKVVSTKFMNLREQFMKVLITNRYVLLVIFKEHSFVSNLMN